MTADPQPEEPPEVRHAIGYEKLVRLAAEYGTAAHDLFDLWRFAHFVRTHAAAFAADRDLRHSAVVFPGNALIATRQDLMWQHHEHGLVAESIECAMQWIDDVPVNNPLHRSAPAERILDALLEADEQRFHEFHPTVEAWQPQYGR